MSLSSTTNKIIYNGNGATSEWPFSFPVLEVGHLSVILTDASGLETTLLQGLYSVTGIGDPAGGSVTYPLTGSPIASGTKLTLLRTVPYTQTTVLSNQGGYYPEVVERRFDQIYMALQQLEERVSRASLYSLSNPATEQANYALIQPLQQMNCLTTQGDLLTRDGTKHKRLPRGSAGQFLGVSGADLAWSVPSQPVVPQGRLTLASGEPVMSSNQAGKTSLFYTPYVGNSVPIYDGSVFVPTAFAERSNDLTQGATGKAGPSAAGPYQCIDAFVWNDAGTVRLTRGPKWRQSANVTTTIASPAVLTWIGHPLYDGATFRFETTGGALPTGFALNTDYFATKVDANNFRLSTTLANQVAGTFINTSGAQSGIHTGANYTSGRGAGAGTTELELLNGVLVNKYDIVNGPPACCGTYVGTIYCNGSSQVDFKRGSKAAGFGEAIIGIWNAYNCVRVGGSIQSTAAYWNVQQGSFIFALSATCRATVVSGLAEDALSGQCQAYFSDDGATSFWTTCAFRGSSKTTAEALGPDGSIYLVGYSSTMPSFVASPPFLGLGYVTALEERVNYTSTVCYNNGGGAGLRFDWRY